MKGIGLLLVMGSSFFCLLPCSAAGSNEVATLNGARAAFSACSGLDGVRVLRDGHVLCLRGTIDPTMFVDLMRVRENIARRPYVVVSGPGGHVDSSIYIVRVLDAYDPVAVVGDMCVSSCAQFLFLMGDRRVLLHCAMVAFHGGPSAVEGTLADKYSDKAKQDLISTIWRFTEFYQSRGITLDMLTKPPADVQKKLDAGEMVFWPWTINQLRAFGVEGIISENDPDRTVPSDFEDVCVSPKQ